MAIKFVRQPSETPNVTNIDDIVPFRYAYGNQNGYVKDKGNELSYTINGSNFRINSGRVVLQGVESDIDANGVTITVDNVSTLRYYSAYYHVNLATNTTSIESTYSTEDYPIIPTGDDLTANTSGSANLELYRFEVLNGTISNVIKVVNQVEYTESRLRTLENCQQSILLFSGDTPVPVEATYNIGITLNEGDVLRISVGVGSSSFIDTKDIVFKKIYLNTYMNVPFGFTSPDLNEQETMVSLYSFGTVLRIYENGNILVKKTVRYNPKEDEDVFVTLPTTLKRVELIKPLR